MTDTCIVLTACGSEETARAIAQDLIGHGLAACVTLLPGAQSYYIYGGRPHSDPEVQLIIYTRSDAFAEVEAHIRLKHTFEVPEIFRLAIDGGSEEALAWVRNAVRKVQP